VEELEASRYGKLGKYSKTIDPGNQMHSNQPLAQDHLPFFRKSLPSQQKLSKTSKLKLDKLIFLSECKNR
jgi:hypothetical protein